MTRTKQSGFTAVELLITLFVAAAFLIASYQLFNLVVKDGGATRAESRASNVAYDYLRRYAASSATIPCTASTPLNSAPVSIDGLTSVTITIAVTCLPDAINSLSKVEATINYNNPPQTIKYALFVSSSGASTSSSSATDGLVAWWKLNGNANNSVGIPNGMMTNTTSAANQAGQSDMAYAFNGSSSRINAASTFGLGATNVSISLWINNPTANNSGAFIKIGDLVSGYAIGMGVSTNFDNGSGTGPNLIMLYENVRWVTTGKTVSTGWHHIVMVIDSAGIPTAYIDGSSSGPQGTTGPIAPAGSTTSIGASTGTTARFFNGSIDDVRIYNRALTPIDVTSLYSAGAQ